MLFPVTVIWHCTAVGNANPGGIFQTRVYGFDGLQTRVPGFMIMSVWRAAGSYCRPTVVVSGHLSGVDLRGRQPGLS